MFGLFKKKKASEKLQVSYERLLKEAYEFSSLNRTLSDQKNAEANEVLIKIEALRARGE